ncbi:hypothetical protein ACO0RG_000200 [Hanseniaspora osmophila]
MSKQTVFISGATGFIAQHIIQQLLDTNSFKVVGSVRNLEKASSLKANFKNHPDLSFVTVGDISEPDAFDKIFEEHGSQFDYLLHTASPFQFNVSDYEKELVVPAVNGTRGVFKAAVKFAPNVKKFVVTSSFAAIGAPADYENSKIVFNEKSWNNQTLQEALNDPVSAYCYSKAAAEREVWTLQKELKPKFAITAVNPVYVFGPQCFDSSVTKTLNTSCELINSIVHSKPEMPVPEISGAYIDVRDVARAHVESITNEKTDGQRLFMSEDRFTMQNVADVINKDFPQLQGKISKGNPGSDKAVIERMAQCDSSATKTLLGFKFKDLEETVVDTVKQILKVEAN